MTAPRMTALDELLIRWRSLSATDRAAFLVIAWRERWPAPAVAAAPSDQAEEDEA